MEFVIAAGSADTAGDGVFVVTMAGPTMLETVFSTNCVSFSSPWWLRKLLVTFNVTASSGMSASSVE